MTNSLPIQSISIPTHTRIASPSPAYIVYNILISTPTSTYTVPHRYTDFENLSNLLGPTPLPLPSKSTSSAWNLSALLIGKRELNESELLERRRGLEGWLRAILSSKDGKWSGSNIFREFLRPLGGVGLDDDLIEDRKTLFSVSTWSTEHSLLITLSRSIKSQFSKRDTLLLQRDASAHSVNTEARKDLVDLVRRIGGLTKSLEDLGKKGSLADGELRRRGQLLGSLQDEAELLGKMASERPRVTGVGREEEGGGNGRTGTLARNALLGHPTSTKAPSRILGNAAVETKETRPLDNRGLLQLQEAYVGEQDTKLEALTKVLRRQRELGLMIGNELDIQKDLLDGLDRDTDKVNGKLKAAGKQMKRLG